MTDAPAQAESVSRSGTRVLVVDDDPSVCAVLVSVLGALGYETIALADPRVAAQMIEAGDPKPDLLIADLGMPHMSGLELIRRGKSLQPTLKTVLSTGEVDQCGEVGSGSSPDAVLEKPFSTRTLAQLLHALIGPPPAQQPL